MELRSCEATFVQALIAVGRILGARRAALNLAGVVFALGGGHALPHSERSMLPHFGTVRMVKLELHDVKSSDVRYIRAARDTGALLR